jgi:hypothetical protein
MLLVFSVQMDAVLETWCWPYVVTFIARQQVPTVRMDTLYSPELSSVTAERGETLAEMSVGWICVAFLTPKQRWSQNVPTCSVSSMVRGSC